MSDPLSPQVRRLFADLAHAGTHAAVPDDPGLRTVWGEAGRQQRGIRVCFVLRLRGQVVAEARYRTYGCPHALAACEWLAQQLEAGRVGTIGSPADWCHTLGIPIMKLGRLLVIEDALKEALAAAKPGCG